MSSDRKRGVPPKAPKVKTVPFGPGLTSLIAEYEAKINEAAAQVAVAEARERGYPEGTRFDLQRRVFLLPG